MGNKDTELTEAQARSDLKPLLYRFTQFCKKWYAKINGYFWLPCPVCGEYFSGAECSDQALYHKVDMRHTGNTRFPYLTEGKIVCKNCVIKAQEMNIAKYGIR